MDRRYGRIFCAVQAAGALCWVGAYFIQDPLLWLLSLLLLLPGSLPGWLQLFVEPHNGSNWSLSTLRSIAIAANVFLFTLAVSLLRLRRKAN